MKNTYQMGGRTLQYQKTDFLHYLFESEQAYEIGDLVEFKGKSLVIVRKRCQMDKTGEVIYTYDVGNARLVSQLRQYNDKITGMPLQGSVPERYG